MKKTNSQKGSAAPIIILIVLVVIAGIWYAVSKKGGSSMTASSTPITLISPNGGETLVIGATTTVSFKTDVELKDGYKVVIWLDDGAAPLATVDATSTENSLVVPSSILIGGDAMAPLATGANKIRVSLYDGTPCTGHCLPSDVKELGSDVSDAEIMIATTSATGMNSTDVATPVISSLSKTSGPIGTVVDAYGKNLAGFEGDMNLWIQNSAGQKGIIMSELPHLSASTVIHFTLKDKYCTADTSYSGNPCPSYVTMVPGQYSLYAAPFGKMSNKVTFTITK